MGFAVTHLYFMETDISLYDFSTAHFCHVKQICVAGTECLYIVTCICFKSVQGYLFESLV